MENLPGETILQIENGLRVWHQHDGVAVVSFTSKANCAGPLVLDGLRQAIEIAEKSYQGLVIWQPHDKFFCVGADLPAVCQWVEENRITAVQDYLKNFQETSLALRYAKIPVIAAVRGYALGGGCELMMHCDQVIACQNSHIGLVESAIGLLPSGGGTKEMILRAEGDFNLMKQHFLRIAQGVFSKDAEEAKNFHYLRESDLIISDEAELLPLSISMAKDLADNNYHSPRVPPIIKIETGKKADFLTSYAKANPEHSEHDAVICEKISNVFFPLINNKNSSYTEDQLLACELAEFMQLVTTAKTIERIQYTLKTGEHLHN